jgi:hypothetical protein
LDLAHMSLQVIEDFKLLYTVFTASRTQDHSQESTSIVGEYHGLELLIDGTFHRVCKFPVFRLAGLFSSY